MELLTVREAVAELGLTARAIQKRIARGEMRAERLGGWAWVIRRDEVERWRERGRLKPGPKPMSGKEKERD